MARSYWLRLLSPLLALASLGVGCVEEPPLGSFVALTYNVAGLPDGLNDDQRPAVNIPKISPKLNAYELVLVQEDFVYTAELRAALMHPYQSYPLEDHERVMNDGLNRFSTLPFEPELTRVRWVACHGVTDGSSDCLANKGFSVAAHELAPGVALTVVNLHGEAGRGDEDVAARRAGFEQLAEYLADVHPDEALLVGGDFNLRDSDESDVPIFEGLLAATGLEDACRALACSESHIDRFLFRSGAPLSLSVAEWGTADELVDEEGEPLSDHPAVRLGVSWRVSEE